MKGYTLHFLSFASPDGKGYNVAYGNGANLQPWHLDALENWLKEQRTKFASGAIVDSGEDLV